MAAVVRTLSRCLLPAEAREPEREARRRSRAIDAGLARERRAGRRLVKILLLGAGESGKSTFLKQMRIIHGREFDQRALLEFRDTIFDNILKGCRVLVDARDKLGIPWQHSENEKHGMLLMAFENPAGLPVEPATFQLYVPALGALWRDSGIREAFDRRSEFQLSRHTAESQTGRVRVSDRARSVHTATLKRSVTFTCPFGLAQNRRESPPQSRSGLRAQLSQDRKPRPPPPPPPPGLGWTPEAAGSRGLGYFGLPHGWQDGRCLPCVQAGASAPARDEQTRSAEAGRPPEHPPATPEPVLSAPSRLGVRREAPFCSVATAGPPEALPPVTRSPSPTDTLPSAGSPTGRPARARALVRAARALCCRAVSDPLLEWLFPPPTPRPALVWLPAGLASGRSLCSTSTLSPLLPHSLLYDIFVGADVGAPA